MCRLRPTGRRKRSVWLLSAILGVTLCSLLAAFLYQLPFVNERLAWRLTVLRAEIKYALSPPEKVVFTPNPTPVILTATQPSVETPAKTPTPLPAPTASPTPPRTPTLNPTPIPSAVKLSGVTHEYQKFNNCGPATLSMALSFWGWEGDQRDTAAFLKPLQKDKNVMPYEMINFIEEETSLKILLRAGGDLDLLKRFIASGIPPVIEMGFEPPDKDWMGHYELVTGFDDSKAKFYVQDTYIMADYPLSYDHVQQYWQHFNYTFLIIYPPEREEEVLHLLGPHADEVDNLNHANQIASQEIARYSDRRQYFAWFNRGTNLMLLKDYAGAADAYDQAFQVYAAMDLELRPWRMLWYQTGPYFAYYYTGRYYDVINLATNILDNMDEPVHEESFYWRALAKEALGDFDGALADFRASLEVHPDFGPTLYQLERLGVNP